MLRILWFLILSLKNSVPAKLVLNSDFMLSLGLTYTTHLIIVFVGTFSSIIYFKQLCNKRSFLGTTTLEKKEQIKKEEERGIVWQCVWRDPRWFSCHCWLIFQESALWSALNHFDISSLLYTIRGRLTIPLSPRSL